MEEISERLTFIHKVPLVVTLSRKIQPPYSFILFDQLLTLLKNKIDGIPKLGRTKSSEIGCEHLKQDFCI